MSEPSGNVNVTLAGSALAGWGSKPSQHLGGFLTPGKAALPDTAIRAAAVL